LRITTKGWRSALVLAVSAVILAGCMPRGAVTNPGWTVVTASDKVVYVALATGRVVALDAENGGAELWGYPKEGQKKSGWLPIFSSSAPSDKPLDAVYGIPALTKDLVLVSSYDHHLYAFDRSTGAKVGDDFAADGAIIGGVTTRDGIAYFGSSDHRVYAVDIASRKLVWKEPFATGNWVWGEPAVDDERVYVGSMDHFVYAINRQTGLEDWRKPVGGSVPGSVTLADGMLLVGGVDKALHAFRVEDGQELWTRSLGQWIWGEALVHDGYVYIGSLDGKVHALKLADGSPRWDAVVLQGSVRAGPALLNDDLIVGTDTGAIYKVNLETGRSVPFFKAEGAVLSTPAVVGSRIYVGTTLGNVYALDASRTQDPLVWAYPPKQK
jgi:outer membrane protein assembly factor BamB